MSSEQFTATMRLQPFRPFTIRMADGRTFPVDHPDFIALSPSGRTVIIFQRDDSYGILDLLLMSELVAAATNGQSPQR
jgi:hypothetical protein